MSNLEINKSIAIGYIEALNSRDPDIYLEYVDRIKDYETYLADPNRRKAIIYGNLHIPFDTKTEHFDGLRKMIELMNKFFKFI